jgi:hypothetical protein
MMGREAMAKVDSVLDHLSEKLAAFPVLQREHARRQATLRVLEQERLKRNAPEDDGRHGNAGSRGLGIRGDEERPEETFRLLPIIPTRADLMDGQELVVRRNRVGGQYQDVEDYLDVQVS